MNFIVGLTGGIGSGKSTVAELFVHHGAALVDTDAIAHALTAAGGAAMAAIVAAFGDGVVDASGALDRAAMRSLVFSDHTAKGRLEAILHPLIRQQSESLCNAAVTAPYVLLVVPLLIETGGYRRRADRILVVDCEESAQVARVQARSGLTGEAVRAIMATQASRAQRRAAADDVLINDGGLDALLPQIEALHRRYLGLARDKARADR
ncbi:MAG TPA: dephospho-CoA kinase [Accumulibacter sp.]|uniref:dephospho-CoA kinase n=1 Tax=Accumulibacter sp. TaxID=2053492 RepID=UPI0025E6BCD5|nr:dephospho-CoA kinase [Accumulibacter sp.]MCM8597345.1 dephospho-CoA kinase [Accumulibacter sp.]MCM8663950.1 dephospho-CoA kinase [Accumulibacter sp.]HNC51802.1 dephospho-CoA kinase [Accumulibacter sp.]